MRESTARKLIESQFVEGLRPRAFRRLKTHLDTCNACRAHYDRLFRFEAAYDGGKAEVERIGEQLFAALDGSEDRPGIFASIFRLPRVVAYATPVAAAAAVLVAVVISRQSDDFGARGEAAALGAHPQLRGACFVATDGVPQDPAELARPGDAPIACPRGGSLKLAYQGAAEGDRLLVVARGREADVLYPPAGSAPPSLVATDTPRPLPGSFAIPKDAPAGVVEIIGYFGREPTVREIGESIRQGRPPTPESLSAVRVDRLQYRIE